MIMSNIAIDNSTLFSLFYLGKYNFEENATLTNSYF